MKVQLRPQASVQPAPSSSFFRRQFPGLKPAQSAPAPKTIQQPKPAPAQPKQVSVLHITLPRAAARTTATGTTATKAASKKASTPSVYPKETVFGIPTTPAQVRATRAKRTHGGNPLYDTNLTGTPNDEVEPQFIPRTSTFVFSANPGPDDNYPPPAPDPTSADADPPLGVQEPAFLAGVKDFHLYYYDGNNTSLVRLGLKDNDLGEQFEPTAGTNNTLVFSAFFNIHNDIYKPQVTLKDKDGNDIQLDYHGLPVRCIATSDDAFATAPAGSDAAISKVLQPEVWDVTAITTTDESGNTTTKYMPQLAPDSSPTVYPLDNRFIVFVSLRGYKADSAATHYTSLWVWDTTKNPTDAGYVTKLLSVPNMSLLNPKFSPDGRFLAFTEANVSFDTDKTKNYYVPDPVFGFDVSKDLLKTSFKSRVWATNAVINTPVGDNPVQVAPGTPKQVTYFKDAEGNESRDMMPFFTALNQIGFSSDRKDTNGDGFADAVETDPTKALFDIYSFSFPYNPNNVGEDIPENTAKRQTLGDATKDDSNELNGSAGPLNVTGTVTTILTPGILYQADDAGNWDLWFTNKGIGTTAKGDLLVGLPVVTPDQDLPAADLASLRLFHQMGKANDYVNISVQVNPNYVTTDPLGEVSTQVTAVVKDPDNRIYDRFPSEVNQNIVTTVNREIDSYPVEFNQADYEAWKTAYGDKPDAPQTGAFVTLKPDPNKPGWFTGKWFTPLEVSDYLLDIAATNTDPNTGLMTTTVSDNIGGFSTAPFVPYGQSLLVSDFAAGQKSVPRTTGVLGTEDVPTESYFTSRPHPNTASDPNGANLPVISDPLGYNFWDPMGPRYEWQVAPTVSVDPTTGQLIYGKDGQFDGQLNQNDPLATYSVGLSTYDLWRTQCREPITYDDVRDDKGRIISYGVLKYYQPYTHSQPGYPDLTKTRTQTVVDHAVLWMAPHAGDLNGNAGANSLQVGTIANLSTQAEILKYLDHDGRFMISGDDVAFVLSQNDPNSANPLLKRLGVKFDSDEDRDVLTVYDFHRTELTPATDSNMNGLQPIPYATWEVHYHYVNQPEPLDLSLVPVPKLRDHDARDDGAPNNYRIDAVTLPTTFSPGVAEPVYYYTHADKGDKTLLGAVQTRMPLGLTDNTAQFKTLFFAFGLEGINRSYIGPVTDADMGTQAHYHSPNDPGTIFHNIVDWFVTDRFAGKVYITNNLASPANVLVYAVDDYNQEASGRVMGTAITDDSGNFMIDGLDSSLYKIYAYKTGFSMQHDIRDAVDSAGNGTTTDNITLIPVQPGSLGGTVRDKATNNPLPGVPVTAKDIQNTVSVTVTTDANGKYNFPNLPAGLYILSTPDTTIGGVDYGAFTTPANSPVTVRTGTNQPYDILLSAPVVPPKQATIIVTVTDASTDPASPAQGAVVSLLDPNTNALVATLDSGANPVTTGPEGTAQFVVMAGTYKVKVTYQNANTTFQAQTQTITALDSDQAPTGNPVNFTFGGILHVFTGNTKLMTSAPWSYATSDFNSMLNLNLDLTNTTLKIAAFDSKTQNWVMYPTAPAKAFQSGLGYAMNLPQDGRITEQGVEPNTGSGGYAMIIAYAGWSFIGDPFTTAVKWSDVKFALLNDPKQTMHGVADANDPISTSTVQTGLWGPTSTDANGNGVYGGSYSAPNPASDTILPWHAYFVRVAQPVVFYVPRPTGTTGLTGTGSLAARASLKPVAQDLTRPLIPNVDTWGLNITATVGKIADRGLALGISSRATNGFDSSLDVAKPSPMDSAGPQIYTGFNAGNGAFFATDIRPVAPGAWAFFVNTNQNAQNVTLTWTPTGKLPAGASLTLIDTATGTRVNMATTSQYTFRSARNGTSRTFRVELGTAAAGRTR